MATHADQINEIADQVKALATDPESNAKLWTLLRVVTASGHLMAGKELGEALVEIFAKNPWLDYLTQEYTREFESDLSGHHSMNVWRKMVDAGIKPGVPTPFEEGYDHRFYLVLLMEESSGPESILSVEEYDIFHALNPNGQNASTPKSVILSVTRDVVERHQAEGGLAVFAAVAPAAYAKHLKEASEMVIDRQRDSERPG